MSSPVREIITARLESKCLVSVEFDHILRKLWAHSATSVLEHDFVISLLSCVLHSCKYALICINTGEKQRLKAFAVDILGKFGVPGPKSGVRLFIQSGIR